MKVGRPPMEVVWVVAGFTLVGRTTGAGQQQTWADCATRCTVLL
jgi:hypothetical protein